MPAGETIVVIGSGRLAHDVVRELVAQSAQSRVVVVNLSTAASVPVAAGATARTINPALPSCGREFADLLLDLKPTSLVVLAFSQSPVTPSQPWLSDAALADVVVFGLEKMRDQGLRPPSLLFLSSTAVYGVAVSSPLVFDERSSLPRETVFNSAAARWAEGLRAVERRLVSWAVPAGARVGVLRTASVLGGPMDSPLAQLLAATVPVRVLGYDPPCQVIHYDDLVSAIALAVGQGCGEVLNLVGRSVAPLSRLLAMAGVFAPPLPGPLADHLAPTAMDGAQLRWRTIADGRRATALLGFRPQYSLEDCLRAPK